MFGYAGLKICLLGFQIKLEKFYACTEKMLLIIMSYVNDLSKHLNNVATIRHDNRWHMYVQLD